MGILTDDMKRLIDEQKLAFHATVCPDGSPNLSPKGFTGPADIHERGAAMFSEGVERMRADGSKLTERVEAIVVINVQHAAPLVSPAYDDGASTEAEMLETQRARFSRLHARG